MSRIKQWICDFEHCDDIAQWYRLWKGELLKLCTKHEAYMIRNHYGKTVRESDLSRDDIEYLYEKEEDKQEEMREAERK